jgi:aryl-alcohol dehydrogenase-like predicted oxidoreductase
MDIMFFMCWERWNSSFWVGIVPYTLLGRGFFGGAHKQELSNSDFRHNQERFKSDENQKMYDAVEAIATSKDMTPSQLALAWVHAQQSRAVGVVAIPGTTKEKNLISNIESVTIAGKLSLNEIKTIEDAVPIDRVEGARYAGASMTHDLDNNPPLTDEEKQKWGLSS